MTREVIKFPNPPSPIWEYADLNRLILWGTDAGMSDLLLRSEGPIWMRLHGNWMPVVDKPLTRSELFLLLDQISHNMQASASLQSSGEEINFAYEIERSRGERARYRGNATAIANGYQKGVRIVLRVIPSIPPPLEALNVEPELLEHAFPTNGLVLITGVMGSGKSTLNAAMIREMAEKGGRNIVTYESPIEFSFDALPIQNGPVSQSQVPEHLKSFLHAIRNSTRIAPDVVLVGESRDVETLRGMIESAEIGVAAYSTVHTRSVPETISRIINVFPIEERNQITSTLIVSLRLIVQQRLLPKTSGGRIAIREFLPFTAEIREALLACTPEELIPTCEELLVKHGQPLQVAAQRLYDAKEISRLDYLAIMRERDNFPITPEHPKEEGETHE